MKIVDVIHEALRDPALESADVDARVAVDSGVSVLGDFDALRSVFQNLVANSVKYGEPPCQLFISASTRSSPEGPAVEITVEDRGQGIPSSELPHIFEPFFRGQTARDGQVEGSGIGVALVKQIVEAHGDDSGDERRRRGQHVHLETWVRSRMTSAMSRRVLLVEDEPGIGPRPRSRGELGATPVRNLVSTAPNATMNTYCAHMNLFCVTIYQCWNRSSETKQTKEYYCTSRLTTMATAEQCRKPLGYRSLRSSVS